MTTPQSPPAGDELDEILLKHRSDAIAIYHGKSNGLDIGTSAATAKAQLNAYILAATLGLAEGITKHYEHESIIDADEFVIAAQARFGAEKGKT